MPMLFHVLTALDILRIGAIAGLVAITAWPAGAVPVKVYTTRSFPVDASAETLVIWTAPTEWSGLIISASSAAGLLG